MPTPTNIRITANARPTAVVGKVSVAHRSHGRHGPPQAIRDRFDVAVRRAPFDLGHDQSCAHGHNRCDEQRVVELVACEHGPQGLGGAEEEDNGDTRPEEAQHPERA